MAGSFISILAATIHTAAVLCYTTTIHHHGLQCAIMSSGVLSNIDSYVEAGSRVTACEVF